jgi:hypothetical protein
MRSSQNQNNTKARLSAILSYRSGKSSVRSLSRIRTCPERKIERPSLITASRSDNNEGAEEPKNRLSIRIPVDKRRFCIGYNWLDGQTFQCDWLGG